MEESIKKAVRATENLFPLSLRLSTSTAPRSQQTDQDDFNKRLNETQNRAIAHQSDMSLLDLVEELSEPGVPLSVLRNAAKVLDQPSWNDILEERHSLGLCPYPTCSKAATSPYSTVASGKLKLKLKGGSLYDVGSKKSNEPFCSTRCQSMSEWFKGLIGHQGEGEMLEDVEVRRRNTKGGESKSTPEEVLRIPRPPAPDALQPSMIIEALSIVERPTPSLAPLPPSLSSQIDFERPSSVPNRSPSSTTTKQHRPQSRLIPFSPATTALLASSRKIRPSASKVTLPPGSTGPIPTFVNDQDSEATMDRDEREEQEELWGVEEEDEGDEIERLIEEGLKVRKLMLESGELE